MEPEFFLLHRARASSRFFFAFLKNLFIFCLFSAAAISPVDSPIELSNNYSFWNTLWLVFGCLKKWKFPLLFPLNRKLISKCSIFIRNFSKTCFFLILNFQVCHFNDAQGWMWFRAEGRLNSIIGRLDFLIYQESKTKNLELVFYFRKMFIFRYLVGIHPGNHFCVHRKSGSGFDGLQAVHSDQEFGRFGQSNHNFLWDDQRRQHHAVF